MSYFFSKSFFYKTELSDRIVGFSFLVVPRVGDVLKVFFSKKGSAFFFEGLCFKTRFKNFLMPDASFRLINQMKRSSISFIFSFFYNLIFSYDLSFFKKKQRNFRSAKIFYMIKQKKFFIKD